MTGASPGSGSIAYDRKVLVDVLVYHYRKDDSSCGCGWSVLGASHCEHVADVYEASVGRRERMGGMNDSTQPWQFTIPCGMCNGDACDFCRQSGEVTVKLNMLMIEAAAKALGSERVGDIPQMHAERALIAAMTAAQEEWNDRCP